MLATRTLYGVTYYPVKRDFVSHCLHCGKKIPILTPAYAKDARNGEEIICKDCLTALSDRYQYEQYGRVPFPEEAPLYVNLIGHPCSTRDPASYITKTAIFRGSNRAAYLPVSYCHKCRRYFIAVEDYQRNREVLLHYRLINTVSGQPIPGSKNWTIECNSPPDEEPEYAPSVVWSYLHPFQGGGCSGK